MYAPRRLLFNDNIEGTEFKFDFQLHGTVTVLSGNSGTGKTLFYRALEHNSVRTWYRETFKGRIYLFSDKNGDTCNEFVRQTVPSLRDALIVMDNASNYLTRADYDTIVRDPNNYYVIITRQINDIDLSPNYFAEAYQEKNNILKLKYEFNKVGWY